MKRSRVLWILACLCLFLTVLCVCLIAAVALLRFHFEDTKKAGSVSGMPPQSESSTSSSTTTTVEPWARGYRLSPHARPLHYDLTLQPNLKQGTFSGVVAITVEVNKSCEFLAVHIKNLHVTTSRVTLPDFVTVFPLQEDAFLYEPHELFVMKAEFPVGLYVLHFEFNGRLTDKIIGFYRSEYMDPCTGTKRHIATSKFQPTYARQAFPCFDEPGFKSKFTIRLVRPTDGGYSALSNMDVELRDLTYPEVIATASYILIAAGAFVFLVSMLGYCGALRESQCLLTCYGVFLVIILIMEITAGSIAAAYKKETEDKVRELLKESIHRYSTKDNPNAETIMWNYFMAELKCCGVDSYKDFQGSQWANVTKQVVPEACCVLSGTITEFKPLDQLCTSSPLAAWKNGCYNEFKRWIDDHINIVMGVGIGLGLLQLLGIFLAFCLCRSIDGYIK